jgi:hypothetical protein
MRLYCEYTDSEGDKSSEKGVNRGECSDSKKLSCFSSHPRFELKLGRLSADTIRKQYLKVNCELLSIEW